MADFELFLVRHGKTAWNVTGQHTSFTDLSLVEDGEKEAELLGKRLQSITFGAVYSSPMQRAIQTCLLSGLGKEMQILEDLSEWNYGKYEGITSKEIHKTRPNWSIFSHGAPEGETVREAEWRAKRVIEQLDRSKKRIILFSHGHFLRLLAACWIGLSAHEGERFKLGNGALSLLGEGKKGRYIAFWNDI